MHCLPNEIITYFGATSLDIDLVKIEMSDQERHDLNVSDLRLTTTRLHLCPETWSRSLSHTYAGRQVYYISAAFNKPRHFVPVPYFGYKAYATVRFRMQLGP